MRLTAALLLGLLIHVSAGSRAQSHISLSEDNAPIERVLSDIQQQSGYYFFYHEEMLIGAKKVTLHVRNAALQDVLDRCFKDQLFTYSIVANSITLRLKESAPAIASPVPGPKPREKVIGAVSDIDDNSEIASATIRVKNTSIIISADARGRFSLSGIDPDAILVVSCVGYESQEILLGGRSEVTIHLTRKKGQLDETVIRGYYTTTERLSTGDASTVKSDEIAKQPVSDPLQALEARVPGLYIQQTSGIPGAYSTVRIMGQNSIANGNDPLYIIDGVPFSSMSLSSLFIGGGAVGGPSVTPSSSAGKGMSPFNAINPSDIESIVVLKDADATAIYGSRGANGVILITTKKGKSGSAKIDFNVYSGSQKVARRMGLLNTTEYLEMRHEAYRNDGIANIPSTAYDVNGVWDTTRYTDWQKVLLDNPAHFTNAQLSISGGTEQIQYLIGGGYSTQGVVYPGGFVDKKASAHINLTHASINKRLNVQLSAVYLNDNSNLPNVDITSYITLAPDAPALTNGDGTLNWALHNGATTWPSTNPLSYIYNRAKAVTSNLVSSLDVGYEFIPGLILKGRAGYTNQVMNQSILSPATLLGAPPYNVPSNSGAQFSTTNLETWILEPQLDYKRRIGRGTIQATVGSTFQQNLQNGIAYGGRGFSSDALLSNPLNATTPAFYGKQYTLYHYDALFGRVEYEWNDRFVINATARRDGSSRFGPGKQFGDFGALGLGWVFSNQSWMKGFHPLSYGKIRGSYGTVGNDQISDYQYLSAYSPVSGTYQTFSGLYPTQIANPYYSWEVVKKLQIGIDLGFIKDRILISASYYRNRDGNQLVGYPLPAITGFTSIQSNFPALVQNSGGEFTVNTINIRSKDFFWTSSVNLTIPTNKLVAYPGLATSSYRTLYTVGQSIYSKKVYRYTGINPSNGGYLYYSATKQGDTSRPSSLTDLVASRPITQLYYGGFENAVTYKGIRLVFMIQFVKQWGYNYAKYLNKPGFYDVNQPQLVLERWQAAGDVTNVGRFSTRNLSVDPTNSLGSSDYAISDASFIRLKNVSLSYQIPQRWQSRVRSLWRVYVQCQNLLTVTRYKGLDPETGGLNLPPMRVITAGVQVSL